jgi:hypothetical protein
MAVEASAVYDLRFEYRSGDIAANSGLHWSLENQAGPELVASAEWAIGEWRFIALSAQTALRLIYRRPAGATRIEGALDLRNIHIEKARIVR